MLIAFSSRYLGDSAALGLVHASAHHDAVALGLVHASAHHDAPSASPQVPGVNDVEWWAASCKAMDVFAIDAEEQLAVQAVLAAVLHIGNLTFEAVKLAQQDDGSAVSR